MKKNIIYLVLLSIVSVQVFAADAPSLDSKLSSDKRAEKCADWARGEVKGVSDAKKKSSEFKEVFQKCLTKNKLPSSLAFSGKYKP